MSLGRGLGFDDGSTDDDGSFEGVTDGEVDGNAEEVGS